jgi:hypothetical protein
MANLKIFVLYTSYLASPNFAINSLTLRFSSSVGSAIVEVVADCNVF